NILLHVLRDVKIAPRSPTTVYAFLAPSVHQLLGLFFAWNLPSAGLPATRSHFGSFLKGLLQGKKKPAESGPIVE
ncbi:hypothetical protein, partial [Pseudomonas sp. FW305-76]|uniref:hypothetical protein n=1 Tax=Pseudomonas sp. FW305-76 TaxID=2751343 RepID=UPI001C46C837